MVKRLELGLSKNLDSSMSDCPVPVPVPVLDTNLASNPLLDELDKMLHKKHLATTAELVRALRSHFVMTIRKGPFICFDCHFRYIQHDAGVDDLQPRKLLEVQFEEEALPEHPGPDFICEHWRPEFWEKKGFKRNWGDAAINNYPFMEVLRLENNETVSYVVLAPYFMRRPATYYVNKVVNVTSWGSY